MAAGMVERGMAGRGGTALTAAARGWLAARGLDPDLAAALGCASCTARGGGEAIAFAYRAGGRVVNRKYRLLAVKRFFQETGAQKLFWNADAITDPALAGEPLVVTEGELDALAAIQSGYRRAVSVPDGAPAKELGEAAERKYAFLEPARSALAACRDIILAVDADGPGQALRADLAARLGKARCRIVRWPAGAKDLGDVLRSGGAAAVRRLLDTAPWCRIDGVYRMSELPPYPERPAFTTGLAPLDPHFRVRMGDFSVVTGIPGHGKSTFVNDILCRMAELHGWVMALASFEQHPQADHRRALREWFCGMPLRLAPEAELAAADAWIDAHFVFLVPGEDELATLAWVLDRCAAAVIRHGARVIVIDPWNELDHDRPPDLSLTEYTGRAIKELKRLARALDVHVMVVAHPVKLAGGDRPSLYSISDSAHWANKVDAGMVIWKPLDEDDRAQFDLRKSRYHDQIGRPGKVWLRYVPATRRYERADAPEGM